ncbi:PP2C family protein-serine/threonine phosphatase [Streptomyces anulatus]|uniref:PP2C family protein-serine/threonine phosphatase n=1 Tax=Streptomyces anulatus TaxID=1892 RepID=UPI0033D4A6DA
MSGSPVEAPREPGAVRRLLGRQTPRFSLLRVDRWGWLVPAAFLVVVAAVRYWGDSSENIENWLLMVPLMAAALCTPWVTAAFGGLVLLVNRLFILMEPGPNLRVESLVLEVCVVLLAVLVAVLRSKARAYVLRLQNAVLAAREVVVRPIPPGWGGVESATAYLPADTESRMGGDFLDVLSTPHGARVVLGDVQGKGLASLSTAGAVVGAFREAGYHERDMAVVAARVEDGLRRHNTLLAAADARHEPRLATAVVIAFLADERHVDVINFGHEGPLVLGPRGVRRLPQEENPPLGLAELTGTGPARISRVLLEPGETVLLVTDGVTEARDRHGGFFPLTAWAQKYWTTGSSCGESPSTLLDRLMQALADHTAGHLNDDATLLAVRRTAASRP